jgi:hypothetical protein
MPIEFVPGTRQKFHLVAFDKDGCEREDDPNGGTLSQRVLTDLCFTAHHRCLPDESYLEGRHPRGARSVQQLDQGNDGLPRRYFQASICQTSREWSSLLPAA